MSARLIKSFADGSQLEFDRGRFDDWCLYLRSPQHRYQRRGKKFFAPTLLIFIADNGYYQ